MAEVDAARAGQVRSAQPCARPRRARPRGRGRPGASSATASGDRPGAGAQVDDDRGPDSAGARRRRLDRPARRAARSRAAARRPLARRRASTWRKHARPVRCWSGSRAAAALDEAVEGVADVRVHGVATRTIRRRTSAASDPSDRRPASSAASASGEAMPSPAKAARACATAARTVAARRAHRTRERREPGGHVGLDARSRAPGRGRRRAPGRGCRTCSRCGGRRSGSRGSCRCGSARSGRRCAPGPARRRSASASAAVLRGLASSRARRIRMRLARGSAAGSSRSGSCTTMPVGTCVIRTAESVVLTLCPPGPLERKTSMRRSLSSMVDVDLLGLGHAPAPRRRRCGCGPGSR